MISEFFVITTLFVIVTLSIAFRVKDKNELTEKNARQS